MEITYMVSFEIVLHMCTARFSVPVVVVDNRCASLKRRSIILGEREMIRKQRQEIVSMNGQDGR
jgi:hypothetical protein